MAIATERIQRVQHYPSPEGKTGCALGVIVINTRGQILVGTETKGKQASAKKAGNFSIPLETMKAIPHRDKESFASRLLGAAPEFLTDQHLPEMASQLKIVSYHEAGVSVRHGEIPVDVAILRWEGNPSAQFIAQSDEIQALQWVDIPLFLQHTNSRPYAVDVVRAAMENKWITWAKESGGGRQFPSRRGLIAWHTERREKYRDVQIP